MADVPKRKDSLIIGLIVGAAIIVAVVFFVFVFGVIGRNMLQPRSVPMLPTENPLAQLMKKKGITTSPKTDANGAPVAPGQGPAPK